MGTVYFKWHESFSVGHETIDEQHKILFGILNRAYSASLEKRDETEIRVILKELASYTKYHFATEEELFSEFNYAESEAHIAEHSLFIKGLDNFNSMIETNPALAAIKLTTFVQKWLIAHTVKSDKMYRQMFKR